MDDTGKGRAAGHIGQGFIGSVHGGFKRGWRVIAMVGWQNNWTSTVCEEIAQDVE